MSLLWVTATRYEVGDPDDYSNPDYRVTQYGAGDKVHPSTFGLPIKGDGERPWVPGQSWKHDRHTTRIPVAKTWGTQDYVYAPHVRNLAMVPGSEMEPIDAYAHPDGTYEVNDHHRACAAHLRGDSHISAYVSHLVPEDDR